MSLKTLYEVLTTPAVGAVVNILAVVSLFFAIRSWRDGQAITESTETLRRTSESIEKSLSTHHLAEFPNYLLRVADLIGQAKTNILIITSVPGLGGFSAPEDWEQLSTVIVTAQMHDLPITLVTLSPRRRTEDIATQFDMALTDWTNWQAVPANSKKIKGLCERYRYEETRESGQWFIDTLDAMHSHLLTHTYFKATKILVDDVMPLLAWIIDGREAIFAFNNVGGAPAAFYTHDKAIVDALLGYFKRIEFINRNQQ